MRNARRFAIHYVRSKRSSIAPHPEGFTISSRAHFEALSYPTSKLHPTGLECNSLSVSTPSEGLTDFRHCVLRLLIVERSDAGIRPADHIRRRYLRPPQDTYDLLNAESLFLDLEPSLRWGCSRHSRRYRNSRADHFTVAIRE